MPSLADIAAPTSGASDRQSYTDYQIACYSAGQPALPFAQWVAAGKPTGPK